MSSPPPTIAAVVFDMDGVLLDTEPLYREAMVVACRDLGFEMTPELHAAQIGIPLDAGDDLMRAAFGPDFPLERYNDYTHRIMQALMAGGLSVKPGARELLAKLQRRGVPAAVATSTANPAAENQLREAGLRDFLATVVTRTDVDNGKPHPEPYRRAAERLGVAPGLCLAIEDSPNGIRSAHAAGLLPVMVPDLLDPSDEVVAMCLAVLPSLAEVERVYFSA